MFSKKEKLCINIQIFIHFLQVIASTVKNFLLLDIGLSVAFPTIVIPALMGLNNAVNPNESVHLNAVQASWLGKAIICFHLILFMLEVDM